MNRVLLTLVAMMISASVMAGDMDCSRPPAPGNIPDGKSATETEMREAQGLVKDFVAKGQSYLACVQKSIGEAEKEVKAAMQKGEDEKSHEQAVAEQKHKELVKLYNNMVGQMQSVADEFNQSLRDFNSQQD